MKIDMALNKKIKPNFLQGYLFESEYNNTTGV